MDKLYYVSKGKTPEDHLENIRRICDLGITLVQLRIKNLSDALLLKTAYSAKTICDNYNASLIINDNVAVTKTIKAYGVHLGKGDMSISEARQQLHPSQHIGGTANTLEDCEYLMSQNIDYIGLGPYRYTTTKKKLSPILGLSGCQNIMKRLRSNTMSFPPIYAIGGLLKSDIHTILNIKGIHGVAASTLFSNSSVQTIKSLIYEFTTNSR